MHEMGIAMQVLEIAKSAIPADMSDVQVERVNLRVGKLAAVVPSSLRFCFEVLTREEPAFSGAALAIEEVPVRAGCQDCGHEWTIAGPAFNCERCKSGSITLISGQELEISSLEVAD